MNRTKYFCACLMLFFSTNIWAQVSPLYIGSYTGNGSDGVYVYDFDQNTGTFTLNKSIKTSNPSCFPKLPSGFKEYKTKEPPE